MKTAREPFFRVSRKTDTSLKEKLIIKIGVVLFTILLFGGLISIISPGSFLDFYESFFLATFRSGETLLAAIYQFALLFGVAICLLPAFKMKYWNLGAAGQVIVGTIGAFAVMNFLTPYVPNFLLLILMFIAAIICSTIWAVIPAIFKARFNTNESLFTLMMNYIALALLNFFIKLWANNVTGGIDPINTDTHKGWLSADPYTSYLIVFIIIVVTAVLVTLYLKFSKQGYEISVVGGSVNTAKYVGINVRKVIIRTLAVSGIISGILAFVLVGSEHNISSMFNDSGYGFSGVLTLWSGSFNPALAAAYSFFFIFVNKGVSDAASVIHVSESYTKVFLSIAFLLIIGAEFFLNYKVSINHKRKADDDGDISDLEPSVSTKEGGNK